MAFGLFPAFAAANPQGGQVVGGIATITTVSPTQLNVTQSSSRAVIDWQSFNISAGEKTQFVQPSPSAIALNRVQVGNPSTIAGQLKANGQIVLVNPSGIVFAKGAQVDVNSLIASTANITNQNFMTGIMKFDQPSPIPGASIVNQGTITVAQKGLAALVAPQVANSGVIAARLGRVVLGGTETWTVDFYGDGLMNFVVDKPVGAAPPGATSLVGNGGTIEAPGGTVLLTANAAAGILANVVNLGGTINAPTAVAAGGAPAPGAVRVDAGPGNNVLVAGTINVSGAAPGQVGGTARVTGGGVFLSSTAQILATGDAGGGKVEVGGGLHGADRTLANARTTRVAAGAKIDASATGNGNGGTVAVWSDGATVFDGTITAKGGPAGGNGGFVETSGHALAVGATASVNALAPRGKTGDWVLDPLSITVATGGTGTLAQAADTSDTTTHLTVDPTTIANAVADIHLQASDFVTFDSAVNMAGAGISLGVHAGGAVNVNAAITTNGGNFTVQGFNGAASAGSFTQAPGAAITVGSANIAINTNGAIALGDNLTTSGGTVTLTSASTITQSGGVITAATLTGSSGGGASLTGANKVNTFGPFTNTTSGLLTFTDDQNLATTGTVSSAGDLTLTTTGIGHTLTVGGTGSLSASNHKVTLAAADAVTIGGTISAGSFEASGTVINLKVDAGTLNESSSVGATTAAVTTSGGGQTYDNAVVLQRNTFLRDTGGGTIAFNATIDGTANDSQYLAINPATSGAVTFGAAVGQTKSLGELVFKGTTTFTSDVKAQREELYGPVVIAGDLTVTSDCCYGVHFHNTINDLTNGAHALAIAGGNAVTFDAAVGGGSPLLSLDTSTAGTANIGANITTTGAQTYGAVSLIGNATLATTNGAVTFNSTINGGRALTITAGTGAISFGAAVGGASALASLSVTGAIGTLGNSITTSGTLALYDDTAVTVSNTLTSTAGKIFIRDSAAGGVTIGGGGAVNAATLASFQTDKFTIAAGAVSAGSGTFELAPFTSQAITIGGAGFLASTGGITAGTFRIGAVTLPNATTSTTTTAINIDAGGFSVAGKLALQTTGNITEDGGLTVSGASSFTSTGSDGLITLDKANHLTGAITFSTQGTTGNVLLNNSAATILTAQTVNGNLSVTDADSIGQSGAITVTGTASFTVTGSTPGTITLDAGNSFVGSISLDTTTGDARLTNSIATVLGNVTLGGALTVTSGGAITQVVSTGISATGLTAQTKADGGAAIVLANAGNAVTGTVNLMVTDATGANPAPGAITFVDSAGFTAGTIANDPAPIVLVTAGSFSNAGGTINSAGEDIVIQADTMTLAGGTINAGTGRVDLLPFTATRAITLQATGTTDGTLSLNNGDLTTITTGSLLQIGGHDATGFLNGNITISGAVTPNTARVTTIALLSGGDIGEDATGTLTVPALGLWSDGSVSLPHENATSTVAGRAGTAAATGDFRFRAGNALAVGTVDNVLIYDPPTQMVSATSKTLIGIATQTTTGGTPATGNIILEATGTGGTEHLTVMQTVSANGFDPSTLAPNTTLGANAGQIGFAVDGTITQDPASGVIRASALEILATDRVSLGAFGNATSGAANEVTRLAAQVTRSGSSFVFRTDGTGLTVDSVDVQIAGTGIVVPTEPTNQAAPISGVSTNNANIGLRVTTSGDLVLASDVNAGTHAVGLEVLQGGISQTGGAITGMALELAAAGPVSLSAANQVGTLAARVTGAGRSFLFRNDTDLTIGSLAPIVEEAPPGAQMLSAGTLNGVATNGGAIAIAVDTAGGLLSNNSVIGSSGADIALLADTMVLDGAHGISAIDAGVARVVLGPYTQTPQRGITLIASGTASGVLSLNNTDLGTITAGLLQIGSSSDDYANGAITISGPVALPSSVPTLALTARGGISEPNVMADSISVTNLVIDATGDVDLQGPNRVSLLAGVARGNFAFRDEARDLTIDALPTANTLASIVLVDTAGGETADPALNVMPLLNGSGTISALPDRDPPTIAGITTSGGYIRIATHTAGNITVNRSINSGANEVASGGEIAIAVAPDGTLANATGTSASPATSITSAGTSAGGNIVILADAMAFDTNSTITTGFTNSGVVVLAPATASLPTVLGAGSIPGMQLGLQPADFLTIRAAGMIQIGYRGGSSYAGSIDVAADVTIDTGKTANLALVTTRGITGSGGAIKESGAGLTLGIVAGDTVTMARVNMVNALAAFDDGGGKSFSFTNGQTLTVDTLPHQPQQIVIDATTGLATVSGFLGPLAGITTTKGDLTLTTTAGDIILAQAINACSTAFSVCAATAALTSSGTIGQTSTGAVSSGSLALQSRGDIGLPFTNFVGTLAANDTAAGSSVTFNNTGRDLTIGMVNGLPGIATNNGDATISTTASGNLMLAASVNLKMGTATLRSAGTNSETAGIVTAGAAALSAVNAISYANTNRVGTLAALTSGADGSVSFNNSASTMTIGTVDTPFGAVGGMTTMTGPIQVTNTGGDELIASNVSAASGTRDVALKSVGGNVIALDGSMVLSSGLIVDATGGAVILAGDNRLDRIAGSAATDFIIYNDKSLSLAPVANFFDPGTTANVTANSGSIVISVNGALTVAGDWNLSAAASVVVAAAGTFTQAGGTLTIAAPRFFVVDTTGANGAVRLEQIQNLPLVPITSTQSARNQLQNAAALNGSSRPLSSVILEPDLAPNGSRNDISFVNLQAPNSTVLLFAGAGAILDDGINVGELGISGAGGKAELTGCLGGNCTKTAASNSFINPMPSNDYRLNTCAIGSTGCLVIQPLTPIQPQAVNQLNFLLQAPPQDDIDAPLINVFDEQRLCESWLKTSPELAAEVCR